MRLSVLPMSALYASARIFSTTYSVVFSAAGAFAAAGGGGERQGREATVRGTRAAAGDASAAAGGARGGALEPRRRMAPLAQKPHQPCAVKPSHRAACVLDFDSPQWRCVGLAHGISPPL